MKYLVTGSSGHLGEALVHTLQSMGHEMLGVDVLASPHTTHVGSITDRELIRDAMDGVDAVLHSATLHKPHVATHTMQEFVDTNVSGTLVLLEEAVRAGVKTFVFTSTTSTFGDALRPPVTQPAAWVTEDVVPVPKNIYGVTKIAAEGLCELFHKKHGLACPVLRTSRFFPEEDDNAKVRNEFSDANAKANEFLYRRVDIDDVVQAHLCALERAHAIGFDRFIVSATTPFQYDDLRELRTNAPAVVARRVPEYAEVYAKLGWKMFAGIDRVYVNAKARQLLGWKPRHDFREVIGRIARGEDPRSALAIRVGSKGYHDEVFEHGPYPVEQQ
jgi:nucleoside-diphosphate-sugar epimerase